MKKRSLLALSLLAVTHCAFGATWTCAGYCKTDRSSAFAGKVATGEGLSLAVAFKRMDADCTPGYVVGGTIAADNRSWADALITPAQACAKNE